MQERRVEKGEEGDGHRIPSRLFRMNALVNGIVGGVLGGVGLLVVTLWLVIKGGPNVGAHLRLLANFFPGYSVTWTGSLLGLLYGFAAGFLLAYAASRLYNFFLGLRKRGGE